MGHGISREKQFFATAVAVLSAIVLKSAAGFAENEIQDKVILVTAPDTNSPTAWPEAEDAVRQELLLMNLSVDTVVSQIPLNSEKQGELQRIAKEQNAAAAIRLVRSAETDKAGVDLWIVDRVTGKTTYRQLEVKSRYDAGATIDVAVRTAEALRASLLELRMVDHQPVKNVVSPLMSQIVAQTRVHRETKLFAIGFGGSVDYSPGGSKVRGAFEAAALVQPISGLDIELNVSISPLGVELTTDQEFSSSTFNFTLIRLMAFYRFFRDQMFQPAVGIAGGALVGWVEGHDAAGQLLLQDTEVLGYLGGAARGYLFFNRSLAIVMGILVGVTLPELELAHAQYTAATFGRPLIEGMLSIQIRFY